MSIVICPKCGNTDVSWIRDDTDCAQYICLECKQCFSYPPKTIFNHITQSPEVLAENLVFTSYFEDCHYRVRAWESVFFPQNRYGTKEEAIAATIKRLNEVAKLDEVDNE